MQGKGSAVGPEGWSCTKETLVPLPSAVRLLKQWYLQKLEFAQESQAGGRQRLKPGVAQR